MLRIFFVSENLTEREHLGILVIDVTVLPHISERNEMWKSGSIKLVQDSCHWQILIEHGAERRFMILGCYTLLVGGLGSWIWELNGPCMWRDVSHIVSFTRHYFWRSIRHKTCTLFLEARGGLHINSRKNDR